MWGGGGMKDISHPQDYDMSLLTLRNSDIEVLNKSGHGPEENSDNLP